jgi:hypothetical protein
MLRWLKRILQPSRRSADLNQREPSEPKLDLPFKWQVVHGRDAYMTSLKFEAPDTTSVVLGSPEDIEFLGQLLAESKETTEEIISRSSAIDLVKWMEDRLAVDPKYWNLPASDWPENGVMPIKPILHTEILSGKPKKQVIVGFLPVDESWKVPAVLRYGDWNDCPAPAIHCAIHRKWSREFGSEIIGISGDIIECSVSRRPESKHEALELAKQQYVYCPDIVHQGVESVEALAETLRQSENWYFWWD